MLKQRSMIILLFALALGGGAAWYANKWVQTRTLPHAKAQGFAVVVAAVPIPFGKKIQAADVRIQELPANFVPSGAYQNIEELENKVAVSPIYPGEILMKEKVSDYSGGSALSAIIAPDKRAVTVRVNDVIGVAGFLLPGNFVDVVASRHVGNNTAKARTILENIKVLAVDQTASTNKDEPVIVRAVTLELAPLEAEELVKATQEGTVQLALRNPLDQKKIEQKVAEVKPTPAPRRARKPDTGQVTIIKGTDISTTQVRK